MAFLHRKQLTRSEIRAVVFLSCLILALRLLEYTIPARGIGVLARVEQKNGTIQKQDRPKININTADSVLLMELKGIGPVLAGRMIKYRSLLGGFVSMDQLTEVYGIDTLVARQIQNRLFLDPGSVRSLDLNNHSFKTFLRHPYLEYGDVKAIFQLRDKLKHYSSVNQLLEAGVLPDSIWQRISPYLVAGKISQ